MKEKKVAIISKDSRLCRLLRDELMLLNMTVDSFSQSLPEQRGSEYLAILCDAQAVIPETNVPIKILFTKDGTSSSASGSAYTHVLSVPFSLAELRKIMLSDAQKLSQGNTDKNEKKYIYTKKGSRTVQINDKRIELSEYELKALTLLCNNAGSPVSREILTRHLGTSGGNIADVYICHLRKKLEEPLGIKLIYTVRGKGYMTHYKLSD